MPPLKAVPLPERPPNAHWRAVCLADRNDRRRSSCHLNPYQRNPWSQSGKPEWGGGSVFWHGADRACRVDPAVHWSVKVFCDGLHAQLAVGGRAFGGILCLCRALGCFKLGCADHKRRADFGANGSALALDETGLFVLPVQSLTPKRIAAAGLIAAGLVLSRL